MGGSIRAVSDRRRRFRHRRRARKRRGGRHRRVREVHRQAAARASGAQPPHGRAGRHRRVESAGIQGRRQAPGQRQPRAMSRADAGSPNPDGRSGPRTRQGRRARSFPRRERAVLPVPASRPHMTFGAGRCSGDFGDSSLVRRPAQSRPQLESPRARGPYTARSEFSRATVLRADAQAKYSKRFRPAYGLRPSTAGPRIVRPARSSVRHATLAVELPITVTSLADTSICATIGSSCLPSCALHPSTDETAPQCLTQTTLQSKATRCCSPVEAEALLGGLRSWTPRAATSRATNERQRTFVSQSLSPFALTARSPRHASRPLTGFTCEPMNISPRGSYRTHVVPQSTPY